MYGLFYERVSAKTNQNRRHNSKDMHEHYRGLDDLTHDKDGINMMDTSNQVHFKVHGFIVEGWIKEKHDYDDLCTGGTHPVAESDKGDVDLFGYDRDIQKLIMWG